MSSNDPATPQGRRAPAEDDTPRQSRLSRGDRYVRRDESPRTRRSSSPTPRRVVPSRRKYSWSSPDAASKIQKNSDHTTQRATATSSRDNSEDPHSFLPPFQRYVEEVCTLERLFRTQLPTGPMFSSTASSSSLSSTKGRNKKEKILMEGQRLRRIVFARGLLTPLMSLARHYLSAFEIDLTGRDAVDFATAVSSWHTSVGLPPVSFSEKDVEQWVNRVILVPSLHIVLALRNKVLGNSTLPTLQRSIGPSTNHSSQLLGPFISSSRHGKVIPDSVVVDVGETVKAVIEVKTQKALEKGYIRADDPRHQQTILSNIQETHVDKGVTVPGRAIKFNWPEEWDEEALDSQTRILMQMWTQLIENSCNLGMLSSYFLSVFNYRQEKTLFMSESFTTTEDILLATIAWMALALGVPGFDEGLLDLPQVNESWWGYNSLDNQVIGIVMRTTASHRSGTRTRSGRE